MIRPTHLSMRLDARSPVARAHRHSPAVNPQNQELRMRKTMLAVALTVIASG